MDVLWVRDDAVDLSGIEIRDRNSYQNKFSYIVNCVEEGGFNNIGRHKGLSDEGMGRRMVRGQEGGFSGKAVGSTLMSSMVWSRGTWEYRGLEKRASDQNGA